MKKSSSTRTLEEEYLSQSSLLSASTNRSEDTISDKTSASPVQRDDTKKRNRFSLPFKSLRLKNRTQKVAPDGLKPNDGPKEREPSPKPPLKRKNRAANLVRKFSLSGTKKNRKKVTHSLESSSSTSSVTPDKLSHRDPPNISISASSLLEMENDQDAKHSYAVDSDASASSHPVELQSVQNDTTPEDTVTMESNQPEQKNSRFSVTYSGVDICPISIAPIVPCKLNEESKLVAMEPDKPERKNSKFSISNCGLDICATSIAPIVPCKLSEESESVESDGNNSKSVLTFISQATINLTRLDNTKDTKLFEQMNKTGSLERGRRFPRPMDDTRFGIPDANVPSKILPIDKEEDTASGPIVDFEVGQTVSTPNSSSASTVDLNTVEASVNCTSRDDYSSLDTSKSSESSETRSEGSRRRIAYVADHSDCPENVTSGVDALATLSELSAFRGLYSDFIIHDKGSSMATSTGDKREHLYKILVIGELGTGKTSFIKRYVHQFFSQNYRATIGVDFALKVLNWDQNTIIRLQLWDIAGQERFGNMTRVYYKEAVGAFIVFDVTRSATFDAVVKWKQDLDSKVQLPNGNSIPCILLANKCDQQKQGIVNTPAKMDEYTKENGFAGWFEVSAKDNINIEDAARALVNKILQNDKLLGSTEFVDNDKFGLDSRTKQEKSCAC